MAKTPAKEKPRTKTSAKSPLRKIVWSVDAFEDTRKIQAHVIDVLKGLANGPNVQIEPVYILSPEQFDLTLEFSDPWVKQYRPAAEKSLKSMLAGIDLPGLREPKILIQRKPSLSQAVRAISAHAKATGADLIVSGTHARSGLSRMLLGSFAESLLLQAKVPVLIVPPGTHSVQGFKHILFPTDLGAKSRHAFKKILPLARSYGATLTLLHVIPRPIEPVLQSGVYLLGGGWVPVPAYLSRQEEVQNKVGEAWVREAQAMGVHAEFISQVSTQGTSQTIVDESANRKCDLIAMAAQSGVVAAALIGSVSRKVVRNSPYPTWIFRG